MFTRRKIHERLIRQKLRNHKKQHLMLRKLNKTKTTNKRVFARICKQCGTHSITKDWAEHV